MYCSPNNNFAIAYIVFGSNMIWEIIYLQNSVCNSILFHIIYYQEDFLYLNDIRQTGKPGESGFCYLYQ
jgi:hypothetical protein